MICEDIKEVYEHVNTKQNVNSREYHCYLPLKSK